MQCSQRHSQVRGILVPPVPCSPANFQAPPSPWISSLEVDQIRRGFFHYQVIQLSMERAHLINGVTRSFVFSVLCGLGPAAWHSRSTHVSGRPCPLRGLSSCPADSWLLTQTGTDSCSHPCPAPGGRGEQLLGAPTGQLLGVPAHVVPRDQTYVSSPGLPGLFGFQGWPSATFPEDPEDAGGSAAPGLQD